MTGTTRGHESGRGQYIRPLEAAEVLGVSLPRIYQMLDAKELSGTKIGSRWEVDQAALRQLADDRSRQAKQRPQPPSDIPIDARFTSGHRYPPDVHPAVAYLKTLDEATARPSQRNILERCARELSGRLLGMEDLPWHLIRAENLETLRDRWSERGLAPSTVNRGLVATRQVLEQCWQLGLASAEAYLHATRVASIPEPRRSRRS